MHPRQCACHRFHNKYDRICNNCIVVNCTNDIYYDDSVPSTWRNIPTLKFRFIVFSPLISLPLNNGAIRNIVKQPVLENWPQHVSIKNNGMPHSVNINKYGNKNAPVIRWCGKYAFKLNRCIQSAWLLGYLVVPINNQDDWTPCFAYFILAIGYSLTNYAECPITIIRDIQSTWLLVIFF